LIRNAVTQGRQAAQAVAHHVKEKCDDSVLDLVIVGAGPAGISASLQAKKENLKFVTLDQEEFGGTIYTYPRRKLVMTQPMELPIYGVVKAREIEKEPLMKILTEAVTTNELPIRSKEKVEAIEKVSGHFLVTTNESAYTTQTVLLAVGRRGTPRKIGCPGEMSNKVAYRLMDAEQFQSMRILVVGGGDSAIEAALSLSQQPGNAVHLSYRGDNIFRIKPGNRTRMETAMADGKITVLLNSNVTLIEPTRVVIDQQGKEIILGNDQVFVLIGGELPIEFLKKVGIEFERKFGKR
jgi:thioredoxin reductase